MFRKNVCRQCPLWIIIYPAYQQLYRYILEKQLGTRDFDLWMVDSNGNHIGWAANHKSDQVMFSGDMTNADPEATEVFYGKDKWPDCTIRVLRFNGEQGSKYRLFFGNDNISDLSLNYMVKADSIRFQEDMISDKKEQVVGIIHDKKVYFSSINAATTAFPIYGIIHI